jgi:hypothetical protein
MGPGDQTADGFGTHGQTGTARTHWLPICMRLSAKSQRQFQPKQTIPCPQKSSSLMPSPQTHSID